MNVVRHEAVRKDCAGEASGLCQTMRLDGCDEICIDEERTAIQRAERDEIAMAADAVEGAESLRACHVGHTVQHVAVRCPAPLERCPTYYSFQDVEVDAELAREASCGFGVIFH